jgi:hypothetical protein
MLRLEGLGRKVERVGKYREWQIHRGRNTALHNLIGLTHINQVVVL